jgi:hypothetical protein
VIHEVHARNRQGHLGLVESCIRHHSSALEKSNGDMQLQRGEQALCIMHRCAALQTVGTGCLDIRRPRWMANRVESRRLPRTCRRVEVASVLNLSESQDRWNQYRAVFAELVLGKCQGAFSIALNRAEVLEKLLRRTPYSREF